MPPRIRPQWLAVLMALIVCVVIGLVNPAHAQSYSRDEMDDLLAPVALYPDPLLAQLLPACTFPDELKRCQERLHDGDTSRDIERDTQWDISVKSLSHYPVVVDKLADSQDWSTAIGQAYIGQQSEVFDSIQRLRRVAFDNGTLHSTSQQTVTESLGSIRIDPARSEYIYVPEYDAQDVYVRRDRSSSERLTEDVIIFGAGLLIGSWLNRDVDWHQHHVYYHGWHGGGWIGRSRSHITINNYYVNKSYVNRPIYVNRTVLHRPVNYDRIRSYNVATRPGSRPSVRFTGTRAPGPATRPSYHPGIERPNTTGRPGIPSSGTRPSWRDRGNGRPNGDIRPRVPQPSRPWPPTPRPVTPQPRPDYRPRPDQRPATRPDLRPSPTPRPIDRPDARPTPAIRPAPHDRPNGLPGRPTERPSDRHSKPADRGNDHGGDKRDDHHDDRHGR